MNQPSSLALSQSKFFQSRLGILLLALVGLAIAAGIYLMKRQEPAAPISPTPATSPAAQAPPRSLPKYGPPAPPWARTDPYGPPAPAEFLASATPAKAAPVAGSPDAVTPGAVVVPPGQDAAGSTQAPAPAAAVPGQAPAPAAPIGSVLSGEIPKSVDASVLFARERYEYIGGGRRDPFQSLLDGRFQTQTMDGSLVDVGDIHLVGIMWGSSDKFALVEDSRGRGYV
ncbi:MAG TPA: hypothetical protein VER38_00615, partial [Candidatus Eisenbacteria bacterium]|nr:hypothetical protein [Candidatus Eisenbacteria bacterium]